jgi:uncharacterized SAM-dependent methyltransferase
LFLGSNIGNFDPPGADEFLRGVFASLAAGDSLLVGTDLVKPGCDLLLAYDDPLGVTAAFNRNLLVASTGSWRDSPDVTAFRHRALWNAGVARRDAPSRHAPSCRIPGVAVEGAFRKGETIRPRARNTGPTK